MPLVDVLGREEVAVAALAPLPETPMRPAESPARGDDDGCDLQRRRTQPQLKLETSIGRQGDRHRLRAETDAPRDEALLAGSDTSQTEGTVGVGVRLAGHADDGDARAGDANSDGITDNPGNAA